MSAPHLRPLEFREIVDGSVTLLRRTFAVTFATALASVLPLWLLGVLLRRFGPRPESFGAAMGMSVAWEAVGTVVSLLAWAALTSQLARAYLGEEAGLEDGLRAAASAMGRLLGAGLVLLPSLAATFAVVMIPLYPGMDFVDALVGEAGTTLLAYALAAAAAVVWAPRLFAVVPAVVVEGLRPLGALERSERLGSGARRRVMGVVALVCAANYLPTLAGTLLAAVWQGVGGPTHGTVAAAATAALQVLFLLGKAAVLPLAVGFVVLLYYDRRARAGALEPEAAAGALAPA